MLRRSRGFLLRFVRHRRLAVGVGLALAAPALWLQATGRGGVWWVDGLSLIIGATGVALFWTGLTGASPDWIDDDQ